MDQSCAEWQIILESSNQQKQFVSKIDESTGCEFLFTQSQAIEYENEATADTILVISQDQASKQQFMKYLFSKRQNIQQLEDYYQSDLQCKIIETKEFDFDDIDQREEQISQYRDISQRFENKINTILILVKFERTDIMKQKLMEIYKYFKSASEIITIVVTDFHLSEKKEEDAKYLKDKFKIFSNQPILFFGQFEDYKSLIHQLKEIIKQSNQKFSRENTIFESVHLDLESFQRDILTKFKIDFVSSQFNF